MSNQENRPTWVTRLMIDNDRTAYRQTLDYINKLPCNDVNDPIGQLSRAIRATIEDFCAHHIYPAMLRNHHGRDWSPSAIDWDKVTEHVLEMALEDLSGNYKLLNERFSQAVERVIMPIDIDQHYQYGGHKLYEFYLESMVGKSGKVVIYATELEESFQMFDLEYDGLYIAHLDDQSQTVINHISTDDEDATFDRYVSQGYTPL